MFHKEKDKIEIVKSYLQTHQKDFYRLAYSYTRNSEDALDVIQESVYKAILNANKLKNTEFIKTWFYRIIVNESINLTRKRKTVLIDDEILDTLTYEDTDQSVVMDLYMAIEQLEPKLRTIIILRYYEDMKLEEIARATQCNLSTVKTRLYKSLEILKALMGNNMVG